MHLWCIKFLTFITFLFMFRNFLNEIQLLKRIVIEKKICSFPKIKTQTKNIELLLLDSSLHKSRNICYISSKIYWNNSRELQRVIESYTELQSFLIDGWLLLRYRKIRTTVEKTHGFHSWVQYFLILFYIWVRYTFSSYDYLSENIFSYEFLITF